jgi:hypothetical protein
MSDSEAPWVNHVRVVTPPVLFACCDDPSPVGDGGELAYCQACDSNLSPAQLRAIACAHPEVGEDLRCKDCGLCFCEAVGSSGNNVTEPALPDPCDRPATHREAGARRSWNLCDYHKGGGDEN